MTQQKPQQQQQWPSGTQQRPNPIDELSLDDIPLQDLHILAADDAARGGRRASEDTKLIPFTELMERLNTNDPRGGLNSENASRTCQHPMAEVAFYAGHTSHGGVFPAWTPEFSVRRHR